MNRAVLLSSFLLAACGKPEDDGDLKAAFAASALKDPSSVQLRNVEANKEVICGEYNSKNSYGAYSGFEPFVFDRLIKDLWLGDSDNPYSRSAFWKQCPNAKELGLNDGALATTDMNATDMNATAAADAVIKSADDAINNAADAVANAQEAVRASDDEDPEVSYDVNNDAGE
jgi:hypothetical protein